MGGELITVRTNGHLFAKFRYGDHIFGWTVSCSPSTQGSWREAAADLKRELRKIGIRDHLDLPRFSKRTLDFADDVCRLQSSTSPTPVIEDQIALAMLFRLLWVGPEGVDDEAAEDIGQRQAVVLESDQ